MTGELLAMRRAALGAPIAEYARLVDRARVNSGGKATSAAAANPVTATSIYGTQVTAGAAHTKGTPWTELVASTSFAAETLIVTLHETVAASNTNTGMLLDIGIGASTAETPLVPDLLCGFSISNASGIAGAIGRTFIVPIGVAAGSRLSARIQGHTASDTTTVGLRYRAMGFVDAPGRTVTAIGVSSSGATTGTVPTTAGSTNTKAAWTDLIAATTADYRYLMVAMQSSAVSSTVAADGLVDIGVDTTGGTSFTVICPDIPYMTTTAETFAYNGCELPYKASIPAGSRLAVRYQCSSTNTSARPAVAVYGIT